MKRSLSVLLACVLAVAVAGVAAAAPPNQQKSRTSGSTVSTSFTVEDGTPQGSSPNGNVHIGFIDGTDFGSTTEAFVFIENWDCIPGFLPYGGPGPIPLPPIDEPPMPVPTPTVAPPAEPPVVIEPPVLLPPPPPLPCNFVSFDEGFGEVELDVDKKLKSATLVGSIEARNLVTPFPFTIDLDLTWTGIGDATTTRDSFTLRDGDRVETYRGRSTFRDASVSGSVSNALDTFTIDDDFGSMRTFRDSYRSRG